MMAPKELPARFGSAASRHSECQVQGMIPLDRGCLTTAAKCRDKDNYEISVLPDFFTGIQDGEAYA